MADEDANPQVKRIKLSPAKPALASLHRSISPPLSLSSSPRIVRSPFQLTHIRDLASSAHNGDTVRLRDLLGDPMIRECWQFNYLIDVDFLMQQFDEDVRGLVQVKVVHGSWKKEAPNRVAIDEACSRYPNVEPIVAYMPEAFGTHHSKMMILLRHDDFAQIIIHTANMIPGDWTNMCQAVWRSPLLPLQKQSEDSSPLTTTVLGNGSRFKRDLLAYLSEYGPRKTGSLVSQLRQYDFRAVRAALVASVPSKQKMTSLDSRKKTLWGWPALEDVIRNVPTEGGEMKTPHIVCQMSSVASLGQTDKWLKEVFFHALCPTGERGKDHQKPNYSIIFPTADEIRRSLNGYASGGSIHMKIQTAAQQKQLQYLRPYLRHWAGDSSTSTSDTEMKLKKKRDAGRRRAAPHIKTYIRFTDDEMTKIDWAMLTSANLSTQAWGATVNAHDEVRICSWEIGVVVWSQLFIDNNANNAERRSSAMIPTFQQDLPDRITSDSVVVGLRIPYDLPLTSYERDEEPWCATTEYRERDWLGQTWM
ncbi:hypothetical protein EYZ11_002762 [Aspergillus tanneri]|uniref:Tyrosyl-DNA phosphodiesterase 1 n=1 Tax=Aspergillus tanneri TaxID=1220188 RepID=A0A4S3JQP7_9EURO|nr:uncharacterized protein ATNIH1004_003302 [Aspergillus tanneri]KAA8650615.1 hypothetical protein ATNIH1004_003302 [Aspergillus tanneri]THC97780.1 hypothetical protein EYZ11_002762 [Aspergillus tanneri]